MILNGFRILVKRLSRGYARSRDMRCNL